jgi:hypothetical protein
MRWLVAGLLVLTGRVLVEPVLAAPAVVVSGTPDSIGVTLYRDPDRGLGTPIDADYPTSFALITEQRTVTLPAGVVVVRFEGVASGIVPQSAILFGPPPQERNRDSALLSQRGLVDAFTGQQVSLRRTDPATGKTVEEPATVRSTADRLVLTTPRGVEAVYCSGLNQTLIYPEVPQALSAKPVLSMTTRDQPGGEVTITLAYLATGFDWDATYVATLAPNGASLGLLGWLTMVSADDTSFPDATTAAVAGRVNRADDPASDEPVQDVEGEASVNVSFSCWPSGTTSDVALPPPFVPPLDMALSSPMGVDEVFITARRREEQLQEVPIAVAAMTAVVEGLGDLNLYRIPEPVTVAANAQKQVAFLEKERVAGELVHHTTAFDEGVSDPRLLFRFRNRKENGLGDPLPAGSVVLYQEGRAGRMLVGETSVANKSVDEEVELGLGDSTQVTIETASEDLGRRGVEVRLTVRNANPFPVRFEIDFPNSYIGFSFSKVPRGLIKKPGKRVWATTLPPTGTTGLKYRVARPDSGTDSGPAT